MIGGLSSRLMVVAQIVVTAALILWLVAHTDRSVLGALQRIDPGRLLLATVVMASAQVWGGLRLAALLHGSQLGTGPAVTATFVGNFFANLLPGTVGGDLVRTVRLKASGVKLVQAAGALVLDRVLNTALIALLAALLATTSLSVGVSRGNLLAGALVVIAGGLLVGLAVLTGRLPAVMRVLREASAPFLGLVRSPWRMVIAATLTLLTVGASILAQWLVLRELALPIELASFVGLASFITLVGLVPISLNGIGLQEASYVVVLSQLGAEHSAAIAFALIVRLLILGTGLIGGAIVLAESLGRLRRASSQG